MKTQTKLNSNYSTDFFDDVRQLFKETDKRFDEKLAKSKEAFDESLVKSQKALDESLAKSKKALDESLAKSKKAFDEKLAKSQEISDKEMAALRDAMMKTDEKINKVGDQLAETDRYLKEKFSDLKDYVGNIGKNNGTMAEEFFYNSLLENMTIDNFSFDSIEPNVTKINRRQNIRGEYDIVLQNGDTIAIVETKYKVHPNDIKNLKEKKLPMFRRLFPEKKDYILYGIIAGMSFPKKVKDMALADGLFVLMQSGGNICLEKRNIQQF